MGVLALLIAGVAAGSILEPARPDPNSSPAATECVSADLDAVPAFKLGVERSPLLLEGQVGYTSLPSGEGGEDYAWKVPDPPQAGRAPNFRSGDTLTVRIEGDRCVRYLVAERAAAGLPSPPQGGRAFLPNIAVTLSRPVPTLGRIPDGDWVVRVTAYFETGVDGAGGLVVGQRYFRVRVGDGELPTTGPTPTLDPDPTPDVTPAAPCGETPASASDVRLDLVVQGDAPLTGATEGAEIPVSTLNLGESMDIVSVGDVCALSWTMTVFNAETGDVVDQELVSNPEDRSDFASQNRWRLSGTLVGPHDVVAALHLGPDLDVVRFWRVIGEDFVVPDIVLTGEDGASVKTVGEYCLSVQLSNGYSRDGECGSVEVPESVPALRVPAWSRVVVEVPGWTLTSWNGQCGHVTPDGGGGQYFEWECSLGGFWLEDRQEPPGPAQFLARPGEHLVQVGVQASSDIGTYNVQTFVRVVGE